MKYYETRCYKVGSQYKIVYLNRYVPDDGEWKSKKEFKSNEKINGRWKNNIIRAKSKVLAYALCNDFEYFGTFTLDKNKYDRENLNVFRSDLSQWVRNLRRIYGWDIEYVLIPELHGDGKSWHMHGLISGIPDSELTPFTYLEGHPEKLVESSYLNWKRYQDKFGFCSFGKIRSSYAVSRYILKYIAKGMEEGILDKGAHLYYASKGLKKPELICEGCTTEIFGDISFQNEFMSMSWVDKNELDFVTQKLI